MNESSDDDAGSGGAREDAGAALRAARERIEVTTREVAGALNLPIRVIEAIEANDIERMPQLVFARGYIRGYARLLDLDADAILAGYDLQDPVVESVRDTGAGMRRRRQVIVAVVGAGLVGLVAVAGVWLAMRGTASDDQTSTSDSAVVAVEPDARDEPGVGAARPSSDGATEQDPVEDSGEGAGEGGEEHAAAGGEAPFASEAQSPTGNGQGVAGDATGIVRITPDGDEELVFTFTDECWVEIKDSAGEVLLSRLGEAGEAMRLVGRPPFRIRLGYASGVTVAYNGENIPLAPHTRNTVASLVLGQ